MRQEGDEKGEGEGGEGKEENREQEEGEGERKGRREIHELESFHQV